MPELTSFTPYLEVFDMVASKAFYCDVLGFEVVFASPEVETREGRFSHFMRLRRGAADLMLNTAYDSNARPSSRDEARRAACLHTAFYVETDDIDAHYAELRARSVGVAPPTATAYGYRAFTVHDPDGHVLTFQRPPQKDG